MNISPADQPPVETSIFENEYDRQILIENLKYDSAKVRNSLFFIGGILLVSDIIGLSMASALNGATMIYVLTVPLVFVGLGFLAISKPMLSMSIAAILFALIIAYNIYALGSRSLVSGLLIKAVIVYFFIKGFGHAKEVNEAKKKLALYH